MITKTVTVSPTIRKITQKVPTEATLRNTTSYPLAEKIEATKVANSLPC